MLQFRFSRAVASLFLLAGLAAGASAARAETGANATGKGAADLVARGRYLVTAGACSSCHTPRAKPSAYLTGGDPLATPFGTFYPPNITPDPETGIGGWSLDDFLLAMTRGLSPRGYHLYPVFPYRWYRNLKRDDLVAMKAYLDTVPAVHHQTPDHDLHFPYSFRPFIFFWKLWNLGPVEPNPAEHLSPAATRGRYIVNALSHCSACHTPTGFLGSFKDEDFLAGGQVVAGGYAAPNITPSPTGIGAWSMEDVRRVLDHGILPSGLPVRGIMSEYVAGTSGRLTPADRLAVVEYLKTVPPKDHAVARTPEAKAGAAFEDQSLAYTVPHGADLVLGRAVALGAKGGTACYQCHRAGAVGQDGGVLPRLDGQSATYLAKQLEDFSTGARPSPIMGPIARRLAPPERQAVADYYAVLQAPFPNTPLLAEAHEASRAKTQQRPFVWASAWSGTASEDKSGGTAPKSLLALVPPKNPAYRPGWQLALHGNAQTGVRACADCHDLDGTGFAPSYPYLAGQHAGYIESQLKLWREGVRHNDPLDVMKHVADRLSPDEIEAVARYYAALERGSSTEPEALPANAKPAETTGSPAASGSPAATASVAAPAQPAEAETGSKTK